MGVEDRPLSSRKPEHNNSPPLPGLTSDSTVSPWNPRIPAAMPMVENPQLGNHSLQQENTVFDCGWESAVGNAKVGFSTRGCEACGQEGLTVFTEKNIHI